MRALVTELARWLWLPELPRHEEVTVRYRAIRGKSVQDYETEILERLYSESK